MSKKIYVGMSGWTYPGWKNTFYPKSVKTKDELRYASQKVNSIEINGTFHALQSPKSFLNWNHSTPDDFVFSVKAGRFMTHVLRLKDGVEKGLYNFCASGLLALGPKLKVILWQFPPIMKLKDDRFEKFLKMIPHDNREMAALAKKHTSKVDGKALTKTAGHYEIRHAFEFRHPSFKDEAFLSLLKRNNIAVVFAHAGKKTSPYFEDLTADFVYLRMHGEGQKYKKGYPPKEIKAWSERLQTWNQGGQPDDAQVLLKDQSEKVERDVFLYFDNAEKVYAPKNATELLKALGTKSSQRKIA